MEVDAVLSAQDSFQQLPSTQIRSRLVCPIGIQVLRCVLPNRFISHRSFEILD